MNSKKIEKMSILSQQELIQAMIESVIENRREDGWSPMPNVGLSLRAKGYDKNLHGKMEANFRLYPETFRIYEANRTDKFIALIDEDYEVTEVPIESELTSDIPEERHIKELSELSDVQFAYLRPFIADNELASSKELLNRFLRNYFCRLKREGKLLRKGSQVMWNTGLSSHSGCGIIGYGKVDKKFGSVGIIKFGEIHSDAVVKLISKFGSVPQTASFPDTGESFNPDYEIRLNMQHILVERFYRFPKDFQRVVGLECDKSDWKDKRTEIQQLVKINSMFLEGSILKTLRQIRDIPSLPVKFWNKRTNSMDWLMPIDLGVSQRSYVALILSLNEENGKKYYQGHTILDTNTAYSNARLVSPVLSNWLRWE